MKHTKGEWKMCPPNKDQPGQRCYTVWSEKDGRICSLTDGTKAKANAQLIAASKDLLGACKEAKTIIYNLANGMEQRSGTELQAIFDEVIKKAE